MHYDIWFESYDILTERFDLIRNYSFFWPGCFKYTSGVNDSTIKEDLPGNPATSEPHLPRAIALDILKLQAMV